MPAMITAEATDQIVTVDGSECRVWQGKVSAVADNETVVGVPAVIYIARVAVDVAVLPEAGDILARALKETAAPTILTAEHLRLSDAAAGETCSVSERDAWKRAFEAEVQARRDIDEAAFLLMARQRGWLAPTETEDTLRAELKRREAMAAPAFISDDDIRSLLKATSAFRVVEGDNGFDVGQLVMSIVAITEPDKVEPGCVTVHDACGVRALALELARVRGIDPTTTTADNLRLSPATE